MRIESKLFTWGSIPFLIVAIIYGWATHTFAAEGVEWVGVVCLFLVAMMTGMVGFYLGNTARKLDDRPEDDPSGNISDAEGDYGFFSPHSWWPLFMGSSALLLFLGLAVGWWIFIIGVIAGAYFTFGWVYEFSRGKYAH